jgi:paraquat-inducible protein B
MPMNKTTNYFKIGVFTLASVVLVIIFCILLGMAHLFQRSLLAETYFDESVQGLTIGSPVKYRGVSIGKVTAINLVNDVYSDQLSSKNDDSQRYIYVQFSLTQQLDRSSTNPSDVKHTVDNYIAKGLRASLATQDLVGNAFLSLNFVDDPQKSTMLPITWKPQYIYIPSTPSTLSQLTDNINNIITNFNKINVEKVVNDFDNLTLSLDKSIENAQLDQLSQKFNVALIETTKAMQQITSISSKANLYATTQQNNWDSTFDALHQLSLDVATISNTIKNNPSAIIFSNATPPMDPTK